LLSLNDWEAIIVPPVGFSEVEFLLPARMWRYKREERGLDDFYSALPHG
jgi:hypothetical protein